MSWPGHALDAAKRSQNPFMDSDGILNLAVVTDLPVPSGAWPGAILFYGEPKAGWNDPESA